MDKLTQDLRFAVRSLRRQPTLVAVTLLTLALGIGAATAMFTVVNAVLLKPLPFRQPERLVLIRIESTRGGQFPLPDADFLTWRANRSAFERIAVFSTTSFNLTGSGNPEVARGAWTSGEFFATLGVQPHAGRFFVSADDAPGAADVVVLGHAFWTTRFNADPSIVGKTPGFSPERLLTFSLNLPSSRYSGQDASRSFYTQLLEQLQALPGVKSAALGVSLPNQVTVTDNFTAEGQVYAAGESAPVGTMVIASGSYFQTLGIALGQGRLFDERDRNGAEAVIVSRTLAERYYPNETPSGDASGPEDPNGQTTHGCKSWGW